LDREEYPFKSNYISTKSGKIHYIDEGEGEVLLFVQVHAENLAFVVNALQLNNITLILHDWGGPIGISYAENNADNVKGLIVFNSWFWSVKEDKTLRNFSKFMGSTLGKNLCKYFNFFPRVLMKMDLGYKKKFNKTIQRHYTEPFPHPETRKGI
jgi:haloalkane dehalogenase